VHGEALFTQNWLKLYTSFALVVNVDCHIAPEGSRR
jgi:hypothetical protein